MHFIPTSVRISPLEDDADTLKITLWTPNVNYSGRTASLTSKVEFYIFIQQI